MGTTTQLDQAEVDKFNKLANEWWQPNGAGKLLHILNKPRLAYINRQVKLANKTVLDLGCGGGILTESLAQAGAAVTGIDPAPDMIAVASQHAAQQQLQINYSVATAEEFCQHPANLNRFDIITCMEMLEHVADINSVLAACAALLKPNGVIFFSTLNRTPKAYLLAILGAEYILQLLPKQTHDYQKFIKPAELQNALSNHDLHLKDLMGIKFNPLLNSAALTTDVGVNYLAYVTR